MARLGLSPLPKADALTDLEAGVDHSKNSHTLKGNLGFAYAVVGETAKAEEQLNELKELYNQHKATGQDLAKIYAGLGRKDEAFEWLEKDSTSEAAICRTSAGIPLLPRCTAIHTLKTSCDAWD